MSPALVLALALRGVALRAEEDRLRWFAPPGALTPEDLEQLRLHREELVSFLRRAQGDDGQAARSQARAEIAQEAVKLVNGRELPLAERPEWEMHTGTTGWPLWLLQQGAWVRESLWPAEGEHVRVAPLISYEEAGSPLPGSLAFHHWSQGKPLWFTREDCHRPDEPGTREACPQQKVDSGFGPETLR